MPIHEFPAELTTGLENPNLKGVQAHHTVRRKSGVPTSGMTYLGLHDSAEAAEAARQESVVKPWEKTEPFTGASRKFTQTDADTMNQAWFDTTEVIELAPNEVYHPHGEDKKTHGVTDGATH